MNDIEFPRLGTPAYHNARVAGATTRADELAGGPPDEFGVSDPDPEPPPTRVPDVAKVSDDALRKALQIIETELPFVIIGLRPTPGGCDFLTAVVGNRDIIAPAAPHLGGALARLLKRNGYSV